ncbi:RNA-dependent ATPase [Coemansia sp. RSA 988]|nr:RNA-dependent ATPase [Coemansia sp. RSA 988]
MPASIETNPSKQQGQPKSVHESSDLKKAEKRKEKKNKKSKKDSAGKEVKNKKRGSSESDKASAKKSKLVTGVQQQPQQEVAVASTPAVSLDEAKAFYEEHNISVSGDDSYLPYLEFSQTPFGSKLLKSCAKFSKPTPIQSACWPVITASRDVIGIAETGSGKTFAFSLPAIHMLSEKYGTKARSCSKPLILVISPTRELAIQTHEQCMDAGRELGITSMCLYGGSRKQDQIWDLKKNKPAIIVATPGRLLDVVENDKAIGLSSVEFLVLDEADRMLDQGFEKDIRNIIGMLPQGTRRQTVMFSATWPTSVRSLADTFLNRPVNVSIGADELAINERVDQIVEVIEGKQKNFRLLELLKKYHKSRKNRVLLFALYKKEAGRLEEMLKRKGYNCVAIHGDKSQPQRLDAIEAFRNGSIPLLVATDVAARGLDVPDVEYVINYTFPLTIDDYTHRCGRTARAGKKGVAHTFFMPEDKSHSGNLINVLRSAKMTVPDSLLKFGTTVKKKQHATYGAFFKDIDPNAKPVKIVFD